MNSSCETIKTNGCFADVAATINVNGKSFTSGGAFIGKDKNGQYGGVLYGDYEHKIISNWDGSIKIPARYYGFHCGNMGDERCFVRFTYKGVNFFGRWFGMDWSQIVRVRQCR